MRQRIHHCEPKEITRANYCVKEFVLAATRHEEQLYHFIVFIVQNDIHVRNKVQVT